MVSDTSDTTISTLSQSAAVQTVRKKKKRYNCSAV